MTTKTPSGTIKLASEIWEWFIVLWRTGNWLLRGVALGIVLWPVPLTVMALVFPPTLTALAAMAVPVAAFLLLVLAYPLATGVALTTDLGQKAFGYLMAIIGVELAIGAYLVFVPVGNAPGSIPLVALAVLAMVFIAPTVLIRMRVLAVVALAIAAVYFTLSFIPEFREGIQQRLQEATTEQAAVTSSSASAPGSAQGGIIVVTESADRIIHVGDDFTPFEFPLVPGEDTPVFSLPSTARDADWRTEPFNEPYEICLAPAGRFVGCYASVDKYGRHDVDFDFSVTDIWFRGMPQTAPGTVIVVTPIR